MSKRYAHGIWWIKRDFRLDDNDALCQAVSECDALLPLFIIEPSLCAAQETSFFHYHAWQQASVALDAALQQRGSRLQIMVGEACDVLATLHASDGFDALYSHEETGSDITFKRDKAIASWAAAVGVPWHEAHQNGVIRGLLDRDKRNPIIRQRLMDTAPKPAPSSIHHWQASLSSTSTPAPTHTASGTIRPLNTASCWPEFTLLSQRAEDERIEIDQLQAVSEADARHDWHSFLSSRGFAYSGGISSPNSAFRAGSRLSTHLAWGTISLRRVFHDLYARDHDLSMHSDKNSIRWRKSLRAFQSRLHWHDHFMQRLESFPSMEFESINPAYQKLEYGDNAQLLEAWTTGRTGLPMVDACMRCLAAGGFLNFRMRAMVVSVACFGFALNYRSLQYPLARLFRDYEPGIHFSQIQMQAGIVGINTIRIYSPLKQLLDHDPQAKFVKRWIPELRGFDAVQIARYDQQTLGDYPQPITDIESTTKIMRDQIYAIRKSAEGKHNAEVMLSKHGSRLAGNDRHTAASRRARGQAKNRTANGTKNGTRNNPTSSKQMTLDFDD